MKDSVCAVVVTYNRKNLLIECLEALRKQTRPVEAIYIIDNASTDGTPELLLETGYIKELPPENLKEPWEKEFSIPNLVNGEFIKIHYVRMHENTGGAGGFHEGVKRAYEKGYDWLWLMDDDAEPKEDALEKLISASDSNKILAICPLIVGDGGVIQNYHHKKLSLFSIEKSVINLSSEEDLPKDKFLLIKEDANAFVGPLISRKAVSRVGFPMKELFIWGDDFEYTLRISKNVGLFLYTGALIKHKDTNYAFQRKLPESQYWKVFYAIRNRIIISYKHRNFFTLFIASLRTVLSIIKFKSFNWNLYKIKLRGLYEGYKCIVKRKF